MIKDFFNHVVSTVFLVIWATICLLLLGGVVIYYYLDWMVKAGRDFICRHICNNNK